MKAAVLAAMGVLLGGCTVMRAFDYDGNPKEPFEFRFGWDHGVAPSSAKPGDVDKNGVYKPESDGAEAILSFPGVSTGLAWEARPASRLTPILGVEAFRLKTPIPYARWWVFQVGGGDQMAEVYVGKLLVPVVDVTLGPWYGWDFKERKYAWGLSATIFKF